MVMIDGIAYRLVPVAEKPESKTPFDGTLPTRVVDALKADGYECFEDLFSVTEMQVLRIPHMGRKGIKQINDVLKEKFGLRIGVCAPLSTE